MLRQVFLAKTVLVIFACCAVWLPISHSCYEYPVRSNPGVAANYRLSAAEARSGVFLTELAHRALPGAPGSCLACFWSHHLFLGKVIVGLGIPRFLPARAFQTATPDRIVSISFDAAFERGPPSCGTAS